MLNNMPEKMFADMIEAQGPLAADTLDGIVGQPVTDEDILADAIEDGLIGIALAKQCNERGDAHGVLANLEAARVHLQFAVDFTGHQNAKRNGFPDTSPVAGNSVTANASGLRTGGPSRDDSTQHRVVGLENQGDAK